MIKLLAGTHAEVREFLIDYVEHALPPLKQMQFRLHLLLCKGCTDYLRRYRTSVDLARSYLSDPPPEELVELTLKFLEERRADAQPGPGGAARPTPR
jgi:hypothetical protein